MKSMMKKFFALKQEGIGVIEIILILVVIIALVLLFKDQISQIVEDAFKAITGSTDKIIN